MQCRGRRLSHEGRTASEQVIENRAERIHIAALADRTAFGGCLLWRDVVWRTEHLAAEREFSLFLETFGQTEVGHARFVGLIDEDVRRLEIAMENTAFVREVN